MNVSGDIDQLVVEIKRLGSVDPADGVLKVKFGVLIRDDRCSDIFEALVGTLKAAKKRKVVDYASEMLLQGAHDDVDICYLGAAASAQ